LHKRLKRREKRLITIIIPRHINRTNEIIEALNNLSLNCVIHSSNQKIQKNTDIYLVDSYGESSRFYNLTSVSFVGGSIIKHGGQNPLEPARLGNYIINGPNVKNFKEIYTFLNNLKMSSSTSNILTMENLILKKLKTKTTNKDINKIIKIGNDVLKKNLFYINKYLI
jgi:3-deoxy-D-manno-octulosonic-acid transferase